MTVEIDILLVAMLMLGGLATAVLSIWALLTKVKVSFKDSVSDIVSAAVRESIMQSEGRTQQLIEASEKRQIEFNMAIKKDMEENREQDKRNTDKLNATIGLTQHALIEAYKQDFRDVYYKLRETGEISDHDKAYIDKIFPYYKDMGGNSDIAAKYAEICRVVERRTQEAFDEARKQKKRKRKIEFIDASDAQETNDSVDTSEER